MGQISTNEFRSGMKVLVENTPYTIVTNEFVKPGKGQPFNRVKLKHLITGKVIERTFKSGEKLDEADVSELKMRLLYQDGDGGVFMNETDYEQLTISHDILEGIKGWLKDDTVYDLVFYNNAPIAVEPPTFMELDIVQTDPAVRGDTSGKVMKPAELETGMTIQVPIFIENGEKVKVDTRTASYVSRV